jgi:uncharacterized membrane protein YkvA (DUF1232 family)
MWKRIAVLWTIVKHDARLLWFALQHPQAPGWLKWATLGLLLYVVSPIDLIPDFVPFAGWFDDAMLVPLVMRWLIGRLPAHVRDQAERRSRGERPGEAEVIDVR